ncbi:hypothetical protein QE152_g39962 [Popillia japonica]|uniref:Uncharacterized protein n=1 Tax=Popillia japonica TaxID=7064 RepID=A0AAW1HT72_POPJA
MSARFKQGYDLDKFKELFEKAEESDFLTGRKERDGKHANWKAGFDWLMNENNGAKRCGSGANEILDGGGMTCKEYVERVNITSEIKTVTGYARTKKASITAIGRNGLTGANAARQKIIKISRFQPLYRHRQTNIG